MCALHVQSTFLKLMHYALVHKSQQSQVNCVITWHVTTGAPHQVLRRLRLLNTRV